MSWAGPKTPFLLDVLLLDVVRGYGGTNQREEGPASRREAARSDSDVGTATREQYGLSSAGERWRVERILGLIPAGLSVARRGAPDLLVIGRNWVDRQRTAADDDGQRRMVAICGDGCAKQ
ncbi:hypothetical protein LR48_Vigan09g066500 [Vigna angularis]|uniref:Uncharacterized protein n=1 Tax=Phaseolus angularis TaxID=3914 RepID=A0A0L9VAB2_PHAAN|nr:hypothetical protein LR48_Vigan09g066500 [Vigna angularis]